MVKNLKRDFTELLIKIAEGDVCLSYKDQGRTWESVFAGEVEYLANGWTIVVFNDCDSFDYFDSAISPDGKRLDYDKDKLFSIDIDDNNTWKKIINKFIKL